MSFDPDREGFSLLQSAYNTNSQSILYKNLSAPVAQTFDFTFNTIGEGEGEITDSNALINTPDGANAFWIGDIRSQSAGGATDYNLFCIEFLNTETDASRGKQQARRNMLSDDQTYGVTNLARLRMTWSWRSSGSTLTPYVKCLGFLLKA